MPKRSYIWDKEKLLAAMAPRRITDVLYSMRLTPSQMQTWWKTQPDVEKMIRLRDVTGLNPLEFVVRI